MSQDPLSVLPTHRGRESRLPILDATEEETRADYCILRGVPRARRELGAREGRRGTSRLTQVFSLDLDR